MPRIDLPEHNLSLDITGLSVDSRKVRPGFVFAALPGTKAHGRDFIPAAVAAGASVVIAPPGSVLPPGSSARLLMVSRPEELYARVASAFYGKLQPETIVAVTGTNGKTSTVSFCWQFWDALGHRAAALGTLGVSGNTIHRDPTRTTPETELLHRVLAELAQAGVTHLAMEASSQGLAEGRMLEVRVCAAGFTNFTRDHLDYHRTMETYFDSKALLFSEILPSSGTAVLPADAPDYDRLAALCQSRGQRIVSFGCRGREIVLKKVSASPEGLFLDLDVLGHRYEGVVPVAGLFQAENILCALGLVLADAAEDSGAIKAVLGRLETLSAPPGRAQKVGTVPGKSASVYVDYAHTPDGLENILKALRAHVEPGGRLICVFGCGGDRDAGKRPLMGEIAARCSDLAFVTDDNPRTEDPAGIRAEILKAAPGALEVPDRREAIRYAISTLDKGDVLVIAGKGHEQGQIIGSRTEPFDDVQEAMAAINQANVDAGRKKRTGVEL